MISFVDYFTNITLDHTLKITFLSVMILEPMTSTSMDQQAI